VTEGYQPPNSRGVNNEPDTATLPRVGAARAGSSDPRPAGASHSAAADGAAGWSPASRNESGRADYSSSNYGAGAAEASGGLGARLSAAASGVASATATAANNAKNSIRTSADEAESRSGRTTGGRGGRSAARQPRRARLTLSHVNVYSVFKLSVVLAVALFFVWLIMIGVLYGILDVSGVFDRVNQAVHQISGDGKTNNVVTGSLVFGVAMIIGVVYVVLFIALSTIGAMVYNLCADLVGGAEVTLSERE